MTFNNVYSHYFNVTIHIIAAIAGVGPRMPWIPQAPSVHPGVISLSTNILNIQIITIILLKHM